MHDFQCSKADDMYNKILAKRVGYFKDNEKDQLSKVNSKFSKKEKILCTNNE